MGTSVKERLPAAGLGCAFLAACTLVAIGVGLLLLPNTGDDPSLEFPELTTTLPGTDPAGTDTSIRIPTAKQETQAPALTLTPTQAGPPPQTWSDRTPTGKIVFTCYIGGFDQICLVSADGSGRRQLTETRATDFYGSLGPDGDSVLFSSRRAGNFDIYRHRISSGETQRMTDGIGSLFAPEYSPDGSQIVFANATGGSQSIWLMDADGRNPRPITSGNWDDIDPTWSPDGTRIAFASSRQGARQLFIMDADGSNVRKVTDLENMGGRCAWSPDGNQLAFYAGLLPDRNIFIVELITGTVRQITMDGDNLGPSWSPDGDWIAFTSYRDGNNEIYRIHPDGTDPTRLTDSPISDWQPRWGP